MTSPATLLLLPAVMAVAAVLTELARKLLLRQQVMDTPNERSSHAEPVPRGGGIGLLAALILPLGWLAVAGGGAATMPLPVWLGLTLVIVVSLVDDIRSVSSGMRFAVQAVAVVLGVLGLPDGAVLLPGALPLWLDRALVVLLWVWFVNLFNFMDGIDGMAGVEAVVIGLGVGLVALVTPTLPQPVGLVGLLIAAAALGFLVSNWNPARVFLGDIGSISLGYLLGWLLLLTAIAEPSAALILPLYFVADATLTLGRRALRGETLWKAHHEHFYQHAVQRGWSHSAVSGRVALTGLALVALALLSLHWPGAAMGVAAMVVTILLVWMARAAPRTVR